jgi:hypothetical protein
MLVRIAGYAMAEHATYNLLHQPLECWLFRADDCSGIEFSGKAISAVPERSYIDAGEADTGGKAWEGLHGRDVRVLTVRQQNSSFHSS